MKRSYIDKCTVFSTIVGSNAYGTNVPDSDIDIRGIAIPNDYKYYFGYLDRFEQFEDKINDVVIYDIKKAFRLMSDANPNMLDILFTEERFHQNCHPIFERVLENRDKFLSKRVRFSYVGYAVSQLKRIKTARSWLLNPPKKKPERSNFGLPDKTILSSDDRGAFQWVMAHLLKNTIEYLNFSDSTKEELKNANWIGLIQRKGIPDHCWDEAQSICGASDEWMEAMKREQAYLHAKRHFDSYNQWKHSRNKKRAVMEEKFGFDLKNAMHLVRIMRMGKEILSTGKVIVFRPDREELKEIRNGSWSYEEVEEYAENMEKKSRSLVDSSPLPKEPDRKFLNQLCVEIIEEYIK